MTSLKIHLLDDDEDELTWRLPEESLEIEYVEWDVMQRCIDRSDYYIENFNCFEKSWNIYDQKTCSDNGCIYYDEECFFCQEAFENAEMVKSALEATSLSNPECSAKAEQRRECEGKKVLKIFDRPNRFLVRVNTSVFGSSKSFLLNRKFIYT